MLAQAQTLQVLSPELQAYQEGVLALRQSSAIDFPAHVHLETQARCNAACGFCPYPTLERKGVQMEDALIAKVINDLADIPKLHRFQLSLFKVNEPFLEPRLFDIIDTCTEKLPNATLTLTTNGSLLSSEKLDRLAKVPNLGYLWVSFNDHREAEYEATMRLPYRRTREKLDLLHRYKAEGKFPTRVVLSRVSDGTAADQEFVTWVKTHYPLFEVSLFRRANWLGQAKTTPTTEIPPIGCTRWFDVSITATGIVAHCCVDGQAQYPIGDVRKQHVLEIYNNPTYRRLRTQLKSRLEAEPCRRCNFL